MSSKDSDKSMIRCSTRSTLTRTGDEVGIVQEDDQRGVCNYVDTAICEIVRPYTLYLLGVSLHTVNPSSEIEDTSRMVCVKSKVTGLQTSRSIQTEVSCNSNLMLGRKDEIIAKP